VFLSLYIIHPKVKELKIDLKHVVNATTLNIITNCCNNPDANMGTGTGTMSKFSDLGTTSAASYAVPGVSVVYKPEGGTFSASFLNKMANTGWDLIINDNAGGTAGTLESWEIIEQICN